MYLIVGFNELLCDLSLQQMGERYLRVTVAGQGRGGRGRGGRGGQRGGMLLL